MFGPFQTTPQFLQNPKATKTLKEGKAREWLALTCPSLPSLSTIVSSQGMTTRACTKLWPKV
jgi:hypothetical protein